MTPKGVVDPADVNPQNWQSDAEQVVRQEAIVISLWTAAENVVERWQAHADLEAH